MVRLQSVLLMCLLAAGAVQAKSPRSAPGQFDYYAVALSWSPSYCANRSDPGQCAPGRKLGFVLHGLWPQFEKGYPQNCSATRLPATIQGKYAPMYPSPKMAAHEWQKHGTCSGLEPAAYFDLSAKMKDVLVIPPKYREPAAPVSASPGEFVEAFRAVNPGIVVDSVLPFCSNGGRFLREVHACFDKNARSRTCSTGEIKRSANSCRKESFVMKNVR